jgi:hypothetical protein
MDPRIPTAGRECPNCGLLHPMRPGESCTMPPKKGRLPQGMAASSSKTEIPGFVNFVSTVRNTFITMIDKGQIKDPEKLLKRLTIAFVKFMEKSKETEGKDEETKKKS